MGRWQSRKYWRNLSPQLDNNCTGGIYLRLLFWNSRVYRRLTTSRGEMWTVHHCSCQLLAQERLPFPHPGHMTGNDALVPELGRATKTLSSECWESALIAVVASDPGGTRRRGVTVVGCLHHCFKLLPLWLKRLQGD